MSKKTKIENVEVKQSNFEVYEDLFVIVKNNNTYFIGIGNQLVVPNNFATAEEAKAYINKKPWKLLVNTTCLVYDMAKKQK